MSKKKTLIVCADDFGMNYAANAAILALAQRGHLSAASCLVDGETFRQDALQLKAAPVQTGLHLNLTDNFGQPGIHMPVRSLILSAYLRRLPTDKVRKEITRQIDLYEAVMGEKPDYIDGHLHVHQLPCIRDALLSELCQRYPQGSRRPWLRSTKSRSMPGVPWSLRLKARTIQTLGASAMARRAADRGFSLNPGFLGVYSFAGGAAAYATYMQHWLSSACDGDVLMCHPESETGQASADPQRAAEFQVLGSPEFSGWLAVNSIVLQ